MAGWLKVVLGLIVVGALGGAWILLEEEPAAPGQGGGPAGLSGLDEVDAEERAMELAPGSTGRAREVERLSATPEAPESLVAEGRPAAAEEPPADEPERPRVRLLGRLIDTAGRPVPDARVVAHVDDGAVFRRAVTGDGEVTRPEATSGADGRFAVEFPLPDEQTEEQDGFLRAMVGDGARLAAVHDAYAVLVEEGIELAEGDVDVGTLTLQPGGGVRGRVVDDSGRPLAEATVIGRPMHRQGGGPGLMFSMFRGSVAESYTRAVTAEDGRFLITGLAADTVEVTAEADGHRMGFVEDLDLGPGDVLDVGDVVLEDGGAIAGYVYDDEGNPLQDASVRVSSMQRIVLRRAEDLPRRELGREMRLRAETDENGWFELGGLGTGQYSVHVTADGFARSSTDNVATGTRDFSARMARLGLLDVLVRSARDGQPLLEAQVSARSMERFGPGAEVDVREGERPGHWVVQGAGPDGTELTVVADGFATLVHEAPGVEPGGRLETEVELLAESVLAGRVVDQDGAGIAGADVSVREWVEPADPFAGGEVRIERNVRRAFGGGGGPEWQRARSDARGEFVIRGVPAGEWELLASADGFVRSEPVHVSLEVGGEQRDVTLQLAPAGVLNGLVVDDQGQPLEAVTVRVTPQAAVSDADDDPLGGMMRMLGGGDGDDPNGPRTATTDDDGRFRLEGLAEGRVLAELTKGAGGMGFGGAMVFIAGPGGGDTIDHPDAQAYAVIVPGEEAFVRLVRPPMATLEGRVLADGLGQADVTVHLGEAGSFLPFGGQSATTDRMGNYRFEGVQPGDYEVSAAIPGAGLEKELPVELEAGRTERADLVFEGQSIRGRVTDVDGGAGVGGLSVEVEAVTRGGSGGAQQARVAFSFVGASDGGGGSGMTIDMGGPGGARIQTDEQGRFEAKWLPPGEYRLTVSGGHYMEAESESIELEDGVDVDGVEVVVTRGAVLHGVVTDRSTGQGLEGVPVTLRAAGGGPEMQMTEPGGGYRFQGLSPGPYTVTVMGSGFGSEPSAEADVELDAGEVRALDLQAGGS